MSSGRRFASPARKRLKLPKVVEAWMFYTNTEEMRAPALRNGYSDSYYGCRITWDSSRGQYGVHKSGVSVQYFALKADAYSWCRDRAPRVKLKSTQSKAPANTRHLKAV